MTIGEYFDIRHQLESGRKKLSDFSKADRDAIQTYTGKLLWNFEHFSRKEKDEISRCRKLELIR